MGLTDLPPELRYQIYKYWFSDRTFKPVPLSTISSNDSTTRYPATLSTSVTDLFSLFSYTQTNWHDASYQRPKTLADIYLISKSIANDPFLAPALLESSTFHLEDPSDVTRLRLHFGDDILTKNITRISLSGHFSRNNAAITSLFTRPTNLKQVTVFGSLTPLSQVWDMRLYSFDKHAWAPFVACLCVFAPDGIPGLASAVTHKALEHKAQLELNVVFKWTDIEDERRTMRFSTRDWMCRFECAGEKFAIQQIKPEELEGVLGGEVGKGLKWRAT